MREKYKASTRGIEFRPVVGHAFVKEQMDSVTEARMIHSLGNENRSSVANNLDLVNSLNNFSPQAAFKVASITAVKANNLKKAIAGIAALALLATACSPQAIPTTEAPFSEPTPITKSYQEDLEAVFSQQGPEATVEVGTSGYPQSLTVEEISESLNRGGGFPPGFPSAGVNEMLNARNRWFEDLGMTGVGGQLISNGKEGKDFRWAIKPVNQNGDLAGWLQVKDEDVEGGWRYAERPTWEPVGFDPASDEFRFTLPEKLKDENSFELIPYGDEFWILVEVDKNGQPVRHLDTVAQEMKMVVGAEVVKEALYSECGDPSKVTILQGSPGWDVIGVDGMKLPTGRVGVEHNIGSGIKIATGRACLTEIEGFTDPNFPDDAIRAKVVFYDTEGKPHEYTIMLGATRDNGSQKLVGLCKGGSCRSTSVLETLETLERFFADQNVSKQVDIDFMVSNNGPASPLTDLIKIINKNDEFLLQLSEALKTGTNFPEVPEGFFLWVSQISYNL